MANSTNNGKRGGLLKGKSHSNGGIKAIVTDSNQPVELEGGEVIINKEASKKHWKELSRINQSAGGGVPILPPNSADSDPSEFAKGGRTIKFNPNHIPSKWMYQYAKKIKENYPKVWAVGGNIFGNEAFNNLERVIKRGYWTDNEEWMYVKWQSFNARHSGDLRIAGIIANLKWLNKVDKGWAYMKDLIEEEIAKKYPEKKAKGGSVEPQFKLYEITSPKSKALIGNTGRKGKGGYVTEYTLFQGGKKLLEISTEYINYRASNSRFSGKTPPYAPKLKGALQFFKKYGYDLPIDPSKDYGDEFHSKEVSPNLVWSRFKNTQPLSPYHSTEKPYIHPDLKKQMAKGGVVTYKQKFNKKYGFKKDESHTLSEVAKETGRSKKGLQQIYNKGIGAYKTNPESVRPNVKSKEQWAMARVYSAVMGGKASRVDKHELAMAKGGGVDNDWYIVPTTKDLATSYKLYGHSPIVMLIKNDKGEKGIFGIYKLEFFPEKAFSKNINFWLVPFAYTEYTDRNKNLAKLVYINKKEDGWRYNAQWLRNFWIKADNIDFSKYNFTKQQFEKYKLQQEIEWENALENSFLELQGMNNALKSKNTMAKGGKVVETLIKQGKVDLKFYDTTPKHAKEYGLKSFNPLFVQNILVSKNERLKGIGKKVLAYIDDYAIKNGNDVVFGHITQKADFTKDDREANFSNINMIKNWLKSNGYIINDDNNDFHKVIKLAKGGELALGIKAESEHLPTALKLYFQKISPFQAPEMIAKEHLAEDNEYYSKMLINKYFENQADPKSAIKKYFSKRAKKYAQGGGVAQNSSRAMYQLNNSINYSTDFSTDWFQRNTFTFDMNLVEQYRETDPNVLVEVDFYNGKARYSVRDIVELLESNTWMVASIEPRQEQPTQVVPPLPTDSPTEPPQETLDVENAMQNWVGKNTKGAKVLDAEDMGREILRAFEEVMQNEKMDELEELKKSLREAL